MKLFIIALVSMLVLAIAATGVAVWFILEVIRFATYCTAQGGQC